MNRTYDLLVIGAGAAGLMAALEVALTGQSVAVIEARDRIGGRIDHVQQDGFSQPVETGAEFIHGDAAITFSLLEKAGIRYYSLEGEMWRHHNGEWEEQKDFIEDFPALKKKLEQVEEDISVSEFLQQHLHEPKYDDLRFTLKNYVEGYSAADTEQASTLALRNDMLNSSGDQYRIEGGYMAVLAYLKDECSKHGVVFFFNQPVQAVNWQQKKVIAKCTHTDFEGLRMLITVPLGVLQQQQIKFEPALPEYFAAVQQLGYGSVIKILLEFEKAFWKEEAFAGGNDFTKLQFIFSDEEVPTWWTAFPKHIPLLIGWLGGPHAEQHVAKTEKEILELSLHSLANIFSVSAAQLRAWLKGSLVVNWQNAKYSAGAYSYDVVNGHRAKNLLSRPVERTLYFAGEALHHGAETGTVEAAFQSGREAAYRIISEL
ncbi:MAG: flavin monoamine oxidase family protein [Flavisolibacter sp.]